MRDKRPSIAAKHKSGFPPHKGGLPAEGRFDFVFLEVTTYGWPRESYNPVKNAMCKRWDTPERHAPTPQHLHGIRFPDPDPLGLGRHLRRCATRLAQPGRTPKLPQAGRLL